MEKIMKKRIKPHMVDKINGSGMVELTMKRIL